MASDRTQLIAAVARFGEVCISGVALKLYSIDFSLRLSLVENISLQIIVVSEAKSKAIAH